MAKKEATHDRLLLITAEVASAYLGHNHIRPGDLPDLIRNVHAALRALGTVEPLEAVEPVTRATPAQIRRSIQPDHLVSFEDGKSYKILRRHLAKRGLTPEAYREKWGLPPDYPVVSSDYSEKRSALAKSFGLGRGGRAASS